MLIVLNTTEVLYSRNERKLNAHTGNCVNSNEPQEQTVFMI